VIILVLGQNSHSRIRIGTNILIYFVVLIFSIIVYSILIMWISIQD